MQNEILCSKEQQNEMISHSLRITLRLSVSHSHLDQITYDLKQIVFSPTCGTLKNKKKT